MAAVMNWVWRARQREVGQGSPEYVGVLGVVALIVAAVILVNPGMRESLVRSYQRVVCSITLQGCELDGGDPAEETVPGGIPTEVADPGGDPGDPGDGDQDDGGIDFGALLRGFLAGAWDEITGVVDLIKSIWSFITDSEFRRQLQSVVDAFIADPIGFARQIIEGLWAPIQAALESGETEEAIGRGLAALVFAVFGPKGANKLGNVTEILGDIDPNVVRRSTPGSDDNDSNGPNCPTGGLDPAAPALLAVTGPGLLLAGTDECGPDGDGDDGGGDDDGGDQDGGSQNQLPEDLRDPEFARGVADDVAGHIAGRRTLSGVPPGTEADYLNDMITNPGPLVRSRVVNEATGETIFIDEGTGNIFIYQPLSQDGGTAFSRTSLEAARTYYENFG
jgi:hypothetical protein